MRTDKGQAVVELAIITPLILILLVGMVEVAYALHSYLIVAQASREGARFASGRENVPDDIIIEFTRKNLIDLVDGWQATVIVTRATKYCQDDGCQFAVKDKVIGGDGKSIVNDEWLNKRAYQWPDPLAEVNLVIVEVLYQHPQLTKLFATVVPDPIWLRETTVMRYGRSRVK